MIVIIIIIIITVIIGNNDKNICLSRKALSPTGHILRGPVLKCY